MRFVKIGEYGEPISIPFRVLTPHHVLYDFEGPRIFTVDSPFGLLLCYVSLDQKDGQIVISSPSSATTVESLLRGKLTVREAILQDWCWLLKLEYDGSLVDSVRVTSELPEDMLPSSGTMLYHSLQPVLSIKLEGADIKKDCVRASVVRQAIDAGTLAIKRIVDIVWEANPGGRPKNILRFLSDLPTQRFAFNSFQVDFRKPDPPQLQLASDDLDEDFLRIGVEFTKLINWASNEAIDGQTEDLDVQELKALERLVPPLTGQVETVTISGMLFGSSEEKRTLTRSSTQKLKKAMKAYQSEQVLRTYVGRIGELDKDELTFKLRDIVGGEKEEVGCSFEPELFDAIGERLIDDHLVTVTGRQVKGVFEISDLSIFIDEQGANSQVQDSHR